MPPSRPDPCTQLTALIHEVRNRKHPTSFPVIADEIGEAVLAAYQGALENETIEVDSRGTTLVPSPVYTRLLRTLRRLIRNSEGRILDSKAVETRQVVRPAR